MKIEDLPMPHEVLDKFKALRMDKVQDLLARCDTEYESLKAYLQFDQFDDLVFRARQALPDFKIEYHGGPPSRHSDLEAKIRAYAEEQYREYLEVGEGTIGDGLDED